MKALCDLPAPAKLNACLHVVGRRADGYHLLQSLFVLIDWSDTLHFEHRSDGRVRRHDIGTSLPARDLCVKAARQLQKLSGTSQGVDITLQKQLPSGAGIGGGSSDAATTLIALNRLWGLHWPRQRLLEIAATLGADVPFFIGGTHAWVEGIGERLAPVGLEPQSYVLVKPRVSIPTAALFGRLGEAPSVAAERPALDASLADWAAQHGRNDLQPPACQYSAELVRALAALQAVFGNARMTGSGSVVFARCSGSAAGSGDDIPGLRTEQGWILRRCNSLAEHPLRSWLDA